ncbi:uncharacterized protein N7469_003813 [Penicillium citrinum]|uniref:Uncharacterized protein n=2 Tax=Penicillium TaxID=5073 RepID=A0A9W9P3V5_PENCI|nr:uncharacterized protein N7469_003813 [Penicillium citrinum]KAJ5234645.1 hypothetical protein N7469_003813 [Penicillium citrinum]KAK5800860.1 hypothetical protein VI817_003072 [Penicillium citrinum]
MSSNTSSNMPSRKTSIASHSSIVKDSDSITNISHNEKQESASSFKRHLKDIRKKWGPLMAAKTHLDDEYNFPPGRYAGQGI